MKFLNFEQLLISKMEYSSYSFLVLKRVLMVCVTYHHFFLCRKKSISELQGIFVSLLGSLPKQEEVLSLYNYKNEKCTITICTQSEIILKSK